MKKTKKYHSAAEGKNRSDTEFFASFVNQSVHLSAFMYCFTLNRLFIFINMRLKSNEAERRSGCLREACNILFVVSKIVFLLNS